MSKNISKGLLLSNIKKDYTLSIVAKLKGKKVDLPLEYAELTDEEYEELTEKYGQEILPLEPIVSQWEKKLLEISFKGHESVLELFVVTNEEVFQWVAVKVFRINLSTGRYINMITSSLLYGKKYNRRRGVRINIDKVMNLEQEGETFHVIVKDLSYCGVGFFELGEGMVKKGVPFILHLTEPGENGEEKLVCKLVGKILNQRNDSGGIFSGCILSTKHAAFLQRYIAMKQLEQISGRKQDFGITHNVIGENWKRDRAERLKASK
ncbi:hypothetical protein SAMN04487829_0526 [Pseudobutyrivibrio sp. NOR37]|uniref:PilZ domain-containing protein n=1 Tax=Pseudobutyrivibrio xylanivorans TaxID=185007 RepID=A0A6M0LEF5_PSEXY|nr:MULTISPECIES: PilZ domain-containing protein [Pseudobutyrivibrio]NEX00944.1 PilZ domain-containing protein [Pseudobutyrivibrio xylanivorans]SFR63868.1 hypothetical protein SAMN04487829_0526 [Pseudobutyrivibrio sp. NOR37]